MVKMSKQEALRMLQRLDDDILEPDYPESLVDEELRAMGADPDEIGRWGVELVNRLKAERAGR
jgi:hypothetical protein